MANSVTFNVNPTFDMDIFAQKLADTYAQKGFTVNATKIGEGYSIVFDKGTGGINTILGMGLGIKANITRNGDTVVINYTDEEWTGKIIAIVVGGLAGWFLCFIPFALVVTGVIGVIGQIDLPKKIGNDATMIAASL